MRIINLDKDKLGTLIIEHNGMELRWKAANYPQPKFSDLPGLFRDLNGYWETLPTSRQQDIFNVYSEIHTTLNEVFNTQRLVQKLQNLCVQLYRLMPMEEVYYWLRERSGVVFPTSLCDNYEENHKPERTYLRSEYTGLAMLAISLRAMVPVWLEFLQKVSADDDDKDIRACALISRTSLYYSKEMQKLRTLIQALASDKQIPMSALIGGIGSENLPEWIFAKAVVRRASIGELSRTDYNVNIVSNVHKYVTSSIEQLERQFGGRINNKYGQSDKDGNEDNSSNIEALKPKQEVTPGDTEFFSVYAMDATKVGKQIDPTIPDELLLACYKNLTVARDRCMLTYNDHQTILVQWCVASVMSPFAVPYEDPEVGYFNLLAVSQALLWHWGFPNIAMLLAVGCRYREQFDYSRVETRSRLSRETTQRLNELFPYYKGNPDDKTKPRNEVVNAIENISELLSSAVWLDQNPTELKEVATIGVVEGELVIHGGLKIDLANLAIFLAERTQEQ